MLTFEMIRKGLNLVAYHPSSIFWPNHVGWFMTKKRYLGLINPYRVRWRYVRKKHYRLLTTRQTFETFNKGFDLLKYFGNDINFQIKLGLFDDYRRWPRSLNIVEHVQIEHFYLQLFAKITWKKLDILTLSILSIYCYPQLKLLNKVDYCEYIEFNGKKYNKGSTNLLKDIFLNKSVNCLTLRFRYYEHVGMSSTWFIYIQNRGRKFEGFTPEQYSHLISFYCHYSYDPPYIVKKLMKLEVFIEDVKDYLRYILR